MNVMEISAAARECVTTISGRRPEAVSRCERNDGGWQVTVELIDTKARLADNDIMATYQLMFDGEGELLGYERTRRYIRGKNGGSFEA